MNETRIGMDEARIDLNKIMNSVIIFYDTRTGMDEVRLGLDEVRLGLVDVRLGLVDVRLGLDEDMKSVSIVQVGTI